MKTLKFQLELFIVCTEVCHTFSRLAANLSEMVTIFGSHRLKIKHRLSFDLNGLKNSPSLHFKNNLKLLNAFVPKIDGSYEL